MRDGAYNLAIETASREGSLALGRGDEMLEQVVLPAPQRHRVDLMPAIDELCRRHTIAAGDLGQLYVSIGPGSFTGLRIACATAQTLAHVLQLDLVAVPTLDVVAQNAPADVAPHLAVCLNSKGDTVYCGVYRHEAQRRILQGEPGLSTVRHLLDAAPRPLALLGDPLGDLPNPLPDQVTVLPAEMARPQARHVWQLGRDKAQRRELTDPAQLVPLYARASDAEQQWARRYGDTATIQTRRTTDCHTP